MVLALLVALADKLPPDMIGPKFTVSDPIVKAEFSEDGQFVLTKTAEDAQTFSLETFEPDMEHEPKPIAAYSIEDGHDNAHRFFVKFQDTTKPAVGIRYEDLAKIPRDHNWTGAAYCPTTQDWYYGESNLKGNRSTLSIYKNNKKLDTFRNATEVYAGVSANGKFVYAVVGDAIHPDQIYDVSNHKVVGQVGGTWGLKVLVSNDGKRLALCSDEAPKGYLVDLSGGEAKVQAYDHLSPWQFSPDLQKALVYKHTQGELSGNPTDYKVWIRDLSTTNQSDIYGDGHILYDPIASVSIAATVEKFYERFRRIESQLDDLGDSIKKEAEGKGLVYLTARSGSSDYDEGSADFRLAKAPEFEIDPGHYYLAVYSLSSPTEMGFGLFEPNQGVWKMTAKQQIQNRTPERAFASLTFTVARKTRFRIMPTGLVDRTYSAMLFRVK